MVYPDNILPLFDDPGGMVYNYLPNHAQHFADAVAEMKETGKTSVKITYWDAIGRHYVIKTITKTGTGYTVEVNDRTLAGIG